MESDGLFCTCYMLTGRAFTSQWAVIPTKWGFSLWAFEVLYMIKHITQELTSLLLPFPQLCDYAFNFIFLGFQQFLLPNWIRKSDFPEILDWKHGVIFVPYNIKYPNVNDLNSWWSFRIWMFLLLNCLLFSALDDRRSALKLHVNHNLVSVLSLKLVGLHYRAVYVWFRPKFMIGLDLVIGETIENWLGDAHIFKWLHNILWAWANQTTSVFLILSRFLLWLYLLIGCLLSHN